MLLNVLIAIFFLEKWRRMRPPRRSWWGPTERVQNYSQAVDKIFDRERHQKNETAFGMLGFRNVTQWVDWFGVASMGSLRPCLRISSFVLQLVDNSTPWKTHGRMIFFSDGLYQWVLHSSKFWMRSKTDFCGSGWEKDGKKLSGAKIVKR